MAETVNQQIADRLVTRQLAVGRYEVKKRREVWAILALLERDLLAAIREADPFALPLLRRKRRAIQQLIDEELTPLVTSRYGQIGEDMSDDLVILAQQEARFTRRAVNAETEEQTIDEVPDEDTLAGGVLLTLFPSASKPTDMSTTGEDWWQRQGAALILRVGDQLMVAGSLDETVTQATARIRGTADQAYQDGVMQKARDDAARLVRTQITNAIGEARVATADANAAQQIVLRHTSVIDNRTSLICLGRDGLRYTAETHEPVGHEVPYLNGIPYHPN